MAFTQTGLIDKPLSGIGEPSIVTVAVKNANLEVKQVSGKYFIDVAVQERDEAFTAAISVCVFTPLASS